ncbi:hypothetical protein QQP08_003286 [Theobroma cacao]|nr:hypothetical protein QQP08_003286 [Theobroma cacao]
MFFMSTTVHPSYIETIGDTRSQEARIWMQKRSSSCIHANSSAMQEQHSGWRGQKGDKTCDYFLVPNFTDNEFDPNAKKKCGNSLISWSRQTSHHRLLSVNVALPLSWRHVTGTRGSRLVSNHPSQRSRLATTTVKIYLFIFRRKESLSL